MANINLLPWRAEQRERRNREFVLQMVIVGLLSMLTAFLAWTFFNSQLENQREANDIVKQANTALDRNLTEIEELEKTREDIVSRMEVIQSLQGTRPVPVHLFDALVRTLPSNLFLTKISMQDKVLTLVGRADNPNTVSDLLRNLDNTRWLEDSAVKKISNVAPPVAPVQRSENGTVVVADPVAPEANYIQFELTSNLVEVNLAEEDKTDVPVSASAAAPNTNSPTPTPAPAKSS